MRDLKAVLEGLAIGAVMSTGIVLMFLLWIRLAEWLLK